MKTEYNAPEVEVLWVETENLICTSGDRQDYEELTWAIILGGGE